MQFAGYQRMANRKNYNEVAVTQTLQAIISCF